MNPYVILVAVAALGLGGWKLHSSGYESGGAAKKVEWDKATADADKETERQRAEGFALAEKYESELAELRSKYARTLAQRRSALAAPVTCPASGRIGDLVVPAVTVRSMFNIPDDAAQPPATAASQPVETVR